MSKIFFLFSLLLVMAIAGVIFFTPETHAATTVGSNITSAGTLTVATTTITGNLTVQDANNNIFFFADNSNHRIGVNTTTPTTALEINGDIFLSGGDLKTDRWLRSDTNTFLGVDTAGADAINPRELWEARWNTAVGYQSLYAITTGMQNTALGSSAMDSLTEGNSNVALGNSAGDSITTGNYNIAVGSESLEDNILGDGNVAIGFLSFANNTNSYNTGLGYQTGVYSNTGTKNTAIGDEALGWFSEGSWNTAVGADALGRNDGKSFANTALGYQAGFAGSAGYANASSTWVGYQSGVNIRTGSSNIALGYKSADNLTTGSGNIIIGYDIDAPAATSDNVLNIGNIFYANGLGNTGTTLATGTVGIGIAAPTAKLQVSRSTGGTEKLFQVGTTTATDLFSVNSKGTVGIATSTPWEGMELAVTGDILLTGSLYKSGTAYTNPDYVFAKYFGNPQNEYIPADYQMLDLKDLRSYVEENHHLPGVEMKDNKVDIFESNRLNLEKIEEMSLYILELEERIKKLEAQFVK